jgi:hypothetical protein
MAEVAERKKMVLKRKKQEDGREDFSFLCKLR